MQFSNREIRHFIQAIDESLGQDARVAVKGCLDQLRNLIPFDGAVLCATAANPDDRMRFTQVINHSYPQPWVRTYLENGFAEVDPVVNYSLRTPVPFAWETAVVAASRGDATHRFLEAAHDHGMTHGIACHYRGGSENGMLMSFAVNTTPDSVARYGTVLRYIAPHLHATLQRVDAGTKDQTSEHALTSREREVLNWVKEGKSSWEIGCILRISERTVKFHINNTLTKLNAVTRSQALAKALERGLI